jgi:hypothetical protein
LRFTKKNLVVENRLAHSGRVTRVTVRTTLHHGSVSRILLQLQPFEVN